MPEERVADAQPLGLGEGVGLAAAEAQGLRAGLPRGDGEDFAAIVHQHFIRRAGAIPLQHGEFGRVQGAALAVAEDPGQREDPLFAGRQQLLHRKFRRGVQIGGAGGAVRPDDARFKAMQVRFVARRSLENGRLNLDKPLAFEITPQRAGDARARRQPRAAIGVAVFRPDWRGRSQCGQSVLTAFPPERTIRLAFGGKIAMLRAAKAQGRMSRRVLSAAPPPLII